MSGFYQENLMLLHFNNLTLKEKVYAIRVYDSAMNYLRHCQKGHRQNRYVTRIYVNSLLSDKCFGRLFYKKEIPDMERLKSLSKFDDAIALYKKKIAEIR